MLFHRGQKPAYFKSGGEQFVYYAGRNGSITGFVFSGASLSYLKSAEIQPILSDLSQERHHSHRFVESANARYGSRLGSRQGKQSSDTGGNRCDES
jgi:hypothetical protein